VTSTFRLYGIASRYNGDADDWSLTREDAEAALAEVIEATPELVHDLFVVSVEFEISLN
jgi:hypothetical protein